MIFPIENPNIFINDSHVTSLRVVSRCLSHVTSRGMRQLHNQGDRSTPTIKDLSGIPALEPGGQVYRYERDRPLVSLTETHLAARDLIYLTKTRKTWPRPKRLGRDDRDLRDLAETREIATVSLTGRPILPLTLKPRSVKLIRH